MGAGLGPGLGHDRGHAPAEAGGLASASITISTPPARGVDFGVDAAPVDQPAVGGQLAEDPGQVGADPGALLGRRLGDGDRPACRDRVGDRPATASTTPLGAAGPGLTTTRPAALGRQLRPDARACSVTSSARVVAVS